MFNLDSECYFSINSSSFDLNYASIKGGAIYYDKYKPALTNVTYGIYNYAPYGSNLAGYPYTVQV
jgi:hypothetical protein